MRLELEALIEYRDPEDANALLAHFFDSISAGKCGDQIYRISSRRGMSFVKFYV